MPSISTIHHISLTVGDIDRSVAWYSEVMGLSHLMDEKHPDGSGYAVVLGHLDWSMCVGLHHHDDNDGSDFTERRTGLDHVSFLVATRAELDAWGDHLDAHGVERSPVSDQEGYSVLVFRDPDDIQLELVCLG